ncbi:collagen alpha-1(I) chain-like isoform X2 [Aquila chrysaetos chrysaetos]|uniref:collagen alpha-1(I) chain-like isoform X2 n=1 Tax=Aquila chrysaetos chrysaetos TaxID=223781 RepID=UPI00117728E1|nr:collagen alpha-1(I) chain-like isoform X2 [Aquila chrysaetos chrysaetos]
MLGELRATLRYERSGGGGGYLKGRRGAEAAVSSRGRRARPAPPPSLPHGGRRPEAGAEPAPPPPRPAALPANGGRTPQAAPLPAAQAGPGPATARAAEGPQGPRARLGAPRPGRAPPQRLPSALREGGRAAPLGALGALGRDRASGGLFPMRLRIAPNAYICTTKNFIWSLCTCLLLSWQGQIHFRSFTWSPKGVGMC